MIDTPAQLKYDGLYYYIEFHAETRARARVCIYKPGTILLFAYKENRNIFANISSI